MAEEEWYMICNEKDIILQKNDDNMYKIDFVLNEQNADYSLINIISSNQLFDLLYELNKDIIETINTINTENDSNYTVINIKNKNMDIIDEKILYIHFKYKYIFDTNKCILESDLINKKEEDKKAIIYMDNFKVEIKENKENLTKIHILFNFNNIYYESQLVNIAIAMYIKKIFYRLKMYFE
jgi:hypothetical protein